MKEYDFLNLAISGFISVVFFCLLVAAFTFFYFRGAYLSGRAYVLKNLPTKNQKWLALTSNLERIQTLRGGK